MRPSIIYIYPLLFFSILCVATSSILIRFSHAPAMIIALYRVTFTTVLAASIGGGNSYKNLRKISHRDLLYIFTAGFFLALHFAFWISSLSYTSIPSSVLFTNLQVIFVLLFSIFILKESVNIKVTGGILVALAGSALIAGGDLASGRFFGDMLALASGLFVAVYFILGRHLRVRVDIWSYTMLVSAMAAIVLFVACILFDLQLTGYPARELLLFFLMALGPGIAGHGILNWALKYVKAPLVSVSILGEAVGASILAYIFFDELLLGYQLLGGIFILLGIYVAAASEKKHPAG